MALEIERKFLASPAVLEHCRCGISIVQGYLHTDEGNTVRVRRAGNRCFFTWKGKRRGCTREEFECELSAESGASLFAALRPEQCIQKMRYRIEHAGAVWDVDVFTGAPSGLILAELELTSEDQLVVLPAWVGQEVTDDERYRNSRLAAQASTSLPIRSLRQRTFCHLSSDARFVSFCKPLVHQAVLGRDVPHRDHPDHLIPAHHG